jgi:hypothetical protein
MGTMSACGVLRDGAPRADGFLPIKQPKNHGEILLVVKMTIILRMKAWPRNAIHKKTGEIAFLCDVHLVSIGKK